MFVVVLIYMLNKAPILTLYTVAPFPILSYLIYKISQAIHHRSTIVQEYLSHLSTFTQESFSGISVIKSYGIQKQINTDFSTLANTSKNKQINLAKMQAFLHPLIALLIGGSNVLVIFIDRKSTRLNSSHVSISYAVFCLKKKKHLSKFCQVNLNSNI